MRHTFTMGVAASELWLARTADGYRLNVDDRAIPVSMEGGVLLFDGARHDVAVEVDGDTVHVWLDGETRTIRYHDPIDYYGSHADGSADDVIVAPMPGTVIAVNGAAGQQIARGDTLLVIESMKLETAIKAPRGGVIETLHVAVGQSFDRSAPLVTLAKAEG